MANTSNGLEEKVAGALCYVVGWASGLVFFLLEKDNKFVRYHAMQSIITFGAITIANIVLSQIPGPGLILAWILWPLTIVLIIVLAVKAYQGEEYNLRWAGDLARRWLDSESK
jgi:uncharacterized membrane protein